MEVVRLDGGWRYALFAAAAAAMIPLH